MNYMTDGVETDESHDALMNKFTALKSTEVASSSLASSCLTSTIKVPALPKID